MSERARLLDLLQRVHDGDAWHGPSVMAAIEGVDAATARLRPVAAGHTIWETALHVVAWRGEVADRLAGKRPSLPAIGDWPAVPDDDSKWADVTVLLEASHRAVVSGLAAMSDADLERPVGEGREAGLGTGVTVAVMVHGLVHHDAYHAGQISLLKKARS